jgi:hypothetical protein
MKTRRTLPMSLSKPRKQGPRPSTGIAAYVPVPNEPSPENGQSFAALQRALAAGIPAGNRNRIIGTCPNGCQRRQVLSRISLSPQTHASLRSPRSHWRSVCVFQSLASWAAMLRISYSLTDSGQQWTLCGQLAGPWVQELRSCWERTRGAAAGSRAVVNLSDVTFIDEDGERLLAEMRNSGVEFVAAGVETKHLLQNLKSRGERPLRRSIGCLTRVTDPCEGGTLGVRRLRPLDAGAAKKLPSPCRLEAPSLDLSTEAGTDVGQLGNLRGGCQPALSVDSAKLIKREKK